MLIISDEKATKLESMGIKVRRLGCLEDERLQKLLEELHINYGQIAQEEIGFLLEPATPINHTIERTGKNIFSRIWGKRQGGYEAAIEINGDHCKLLAGSKLKKDAAPYLSKNPKFLGYNTKRDNFLSSHIQDIEKHEDKETFYTLKNDILIESPVLACVVVDGLQDNGKGWRDKNGLTIEEWRTKQ